MPEHFEFRPVTADEMPDFRRLTVYVFADNEDSQEEDTLRPEWTQAAFHGGRMVASAAAYPFKLRMNGRGVLADGVMAVGTDPGYRRRGLVRRLVGDLLARAHDNGYPVAILYASMGAIYQRFVWRDINGYRGLWEFIRGHDLVGEVNTRFTAPDDPAPAMLLEPRVLNRRTGDGIWLRVVDAASALAGRGYQHVGETTVEIEQDAECPWNVGTYRLATDRLATDGVQAEAEKVQGSGEFRVTPHGLASLLAGQASPSQLIRIGRAAGANSLTASRLVALDALFSTRFAPHCMNEF